MNYKGFALYQQNEEGKFVLVNEKQVIKRADGITYERKIKTNNYNKLISLRISEKQYDMLSKIAKEENCKISEVIKNAINEYLEIEE